MIQSYVYTEHQPLSRGLAATKIDVKDLYDTHEKMNGPLAKLRLSPSQIVAVKQTQTCDGGWIDLVITIIYDDLKYPESEAKL